MAMLFPGITKCPICEKVIDTGENHVMFPAFSGERSKFAIFSDHVLHQECFNNHPLKYDLRDAVNEAIELDDQRKEQWGWFVEYLDELIGNEELKDDD